MKAPRSFKGRISLWSAVVFVVLYGTAYTLVLAFDLRNNRRDLQVMLAAEAEALARHYAAKASSAGFELPPAYAVVRERPIPVWLRLVRDQRVLAATPGFPRLPMASGPEAAAGRLVLRDVDGQGRVATVQRRVPGRPELVVEAVAPLDLLVHRRRTLMLAMGIAGVLLLPLAALGAHLLAESALRPVAGLIGAVRGLDSHRLDQRLTAPGAVAEIAELTEEFNRLLDRLEESVATMQRFTADASHELRTPISILRTGLEVALRKERTPEEYREILREDLVEIGRIQRIVEGLLMLARSQRGAGRHEVPGTVLDLSATVEAAVRSVQPLAGEKEVDLAAEVEPEVQVVGDADQLRLAIVNLLDNAIKFTPAGRAVRVRLEARDERARFEVRDEGPGVAPEDRPFIFDRFFRGKGPHASGASAGGLGLSVVRWVAQIHGGEVRLLEGDGPGAAFEISLPLAAAPQAGALARAG